MTLVQSWKDSVQLLKPKNFKLFAMVTIKSIIEAYKLYFKYFWWLLAVMLLFFLCITPDSLVHSVALLSFVHIIYGLLFLGVCFITRPSILQKDYSYLRTQFKKNLWNVLFIPLLFISPYSPWSVFLILFFADSEGGFKKFLLSMWNALKMMIYNLPLILVITLFLVMVNGFFYIPILFLNYLYFIAPLRYLFTAIGAFLMPITICTYTNIYIKRLHDQFDLYFKQPE